MEVADRLCQPSLVAHVESIMVDVLSLAADSHKDLTDIVLSLLEPSQVTTLSLCSNYTVYRKKVIHLSSTHYQILFSLHTPV